MVPVTTSATSGYARCFIMVWHIAHADGSQINPSDIPSVHACPNELEQIRTRHGCKDRLYGHKVS